MHLIPIAWLYVALMMAVADAVHPQGSVLGALVTFLLYGLGPVALVLYLLATPARRRARRAAAEAENAVTSAASEPQPDARSESTGGRVAPVRKEL